MPFGGGLLAGAGIVSNIIGGIAGGQAGAGDRAAGQAAASQAFAQLGQIGLPPDEAKAIIYKQFQQKGLMTPELEQHINQTASQMANVQGSQPAQNAQLQALQILQQRGQTGLTPEDRSALNQIRQQVAADTNAKQQAIQQQFAARGEGGSGAELIGQLQAAQSGANQASTSGDQIAAIASQNALQAIGQAGTLGGQIQQQQFGEQAQKAQAQDIINQFNTQNQVQQQARNVGAQNQAQAANLGNAQSLANANTQQSNQELLRQNQAQRQQYLDTLNRAKTISDAAGGYNSQMQAAGQAASSAAAAPWQAVGAGGMTIGSQVMKNSGSNNNNNSTAYDQGVLDSYADGGDVQPTEPSFADKLKAYFDTRGPVQTQNVDPNLANAVSQSFKSTYSDGGGVTNPLLHQSRLPVTDYRTGGHVPGQANVQGDSPKNDTVPAMLSPGEFVVKRSQAKSPFGKKLIKLLEAHSEVMKHAPKDE